MVIEDPKPKTSYDAFKEKHPVIHTIMAGILCVIGIPYFIIMLPIACFIIAVAALQGVWKDSKIIK